MIQQYLGALSCIFIAWYLYAQAKTIKGKDKQSVENKVGAYLGAALFLLSGLYSVRLLGLLCLIPYFYGFACLEVSYAQYKLGNLRTSFETFSLSIIFYLLSYFIMNKFPVNLFG
ncbi:MAG: hypothetical protein J0H68_09900 [Sphingobacteriia bacterium]|nr:hypothetical protein [Sphingobacteriia bacterium]